MVQRNNGAGKLKGTRARMFNQDTADRICQRLADGSSLRKAAKAEGVGIQTVLDWAEASPDFAGQYAQARARGYSLLADEIIEISDDSQGDVIDTEQGPRVDAERVARAKLRVDSRKWMLSKMLPKVYGDKVDVNHAGTVNQSIKVEFG